MAYKVKSWLRIDSNHDNYNGELGPFAERPTAERALVSLCQSGKATSGEVFEVEVADDDDSPPSFGETRAAVRASQLASAKTVVGLLREHTRICGKTDSFATDALAEAESLSEAIENS